MTQPTQPSAGVLPGVGFALAAGLLWGLVFVTPLLLPGYPAALLSVARYLAFGLIALPLAMLDWRELARLTRADWLEALRLALVAFLGCTLTACMAPGAPPRATPHKP